MNSLTNILNELSQQKLPIDFQEILIAILFSTIAAYFIDWLYKKFYPNPYQSLKITNSFFIIAPAITGIFIAIQYSLPLSLGLLGALSFVRFRTPIKDPEEIGFLLLLISVSISAATYNFVLLILLLVTSYFTLLARNKYLLKFDKNITNVILSITSKDNNLDNLTNFLNDQNIDFELLTSEKNNKTYQFNFWVKNITDKTKLNNVLNDYKKAITYEIFME